MTIRYVETSELVNANVKKIKTVDLDVAPTSSVGSVPHAVRPYVTVVESGDSQIHKTVLTLAALPITMRDTEQGGGAQIYTFPLGRIFHMGSIGSIAVTTTSVLADTLNAGVTCNWGVGTTTQASATVATTEQDLVNVAAFTASATINVAGATATGVGAAVLASHDGTTTAKAAFLNLAVATATDIDANATVTVSGTITINWMNIGDY